MKFVLNDDIQAKSATLMTYYNICTCCSPDNAAVSCCPPPPPCNGLPYLHWNPIFF